MNSQPHQSDPVLSQPVRKEGTFEFVRVRQGTLLLAHIHSIESLDKPPSQSRCSLIPQPVSQPR